MATGQQIIDLAALHLGENYILGSIAPKNNPNFKGPWDCAEYVSWCIFQASQIEIGYRNNDAYTGYWGEDATTKCMPINVETAAATAGAVLLRIPLLGQIGHIVFSDGRGGTLEAKGKNYGVLRDKIDKRLWTHALLVNGVSYITDNNLGFVYHPPVNNFFLSNPPIQDNLVLLAKQKLVAFGINPGNLNRTYDAIMAAAIHNYQLSKGLVVDGVMGKQTLRSLKVIA
jgi:N-acetylmuramoyl-L-alanine amidase